MTTETKRIPAVSADTTADGAVKFTFSDGRALLIEPWRLSDTIRHAAVVHGLKAKLVDAAAIARNPDTGRSATIDDKYDAVREIYDRITSPDGTWNKVRGDGTGSAGSGLLVRALMQLFGKTRAEVDAKLAGMTKEQRAAMPGNKRVAEVMAQLRAAQSSIDSDELLDEAFGD